MGIFLYTTAKEHLYIRESLLEDTLIIITIYYLDANNLFITATITTQFVATYPKWIMIYIYCIGSKRKGEYQCRCHAAFLLEIVTLYKLGLLIYT